MSAGSTNKRGMKLEMLFDTTKRLLMNSDNDPIDCIKNLLENKSTAKQATYRHILNAFAVFSNEAQRVVDELLKRAHPDDKDVTVEFNVINEHEFDVKLAGDMLIF